MPLDHATRSTRTVAVLLPLPLGAAYTYRVPEDIDVVPGSIVEIPLGNRKVYGVVWDAEPGDVAPEKLKDIAGVADVPPLPDVSRRFVEWVAAYNLSSQGAVLRMTMSVPSAFQRPKPLIGYAVAGSTPDIRMTAARARVLAVLADGPPRPPAELARDAGVGTSVVSGLAKAGALASVELRHPSPFESPDWQASGPILTPEQAAAAEDLRKKVAAAEFGVTLLDGVPGSGKTEVYFEAIAEALAAGKQALVMLPEIALSAQWLSRFRARFGCKPAEWHSDLTQARRRTTWRAVASGEADVVVGARSSLFLPFADLGLIVVDEEHESAFKQEDGVVYNARDMAIVRAQLGGIPAVLASATPSLETVTNVKLSRYGRLVLPDRHSGAVAPEVQVVDMRIDKPERGQWLSSALTRAMAETLEAGEQILLFLNRRGYAPLTLCRGCGHRFQCPRCVTWLVEHRLLSRLQCHHCGYLEPFPSRCPECDAEDTLFACGPGVERLAEEVAQIFPDIRTTIAASDTIMGPTAAAEFVRRIEDREVDLVIGTQIVAKGYHFPHLTLVGVIDADLGLMGGDLRAAERTYQLLYQVAGRAGRAERPGRVLVQTYMPEHPVMAALTSGQRERFLDAEAQERQSAQMPPFGKLVAVVLSGTDEGAVDAAANALARAAPNGENIRVLGPAPAPLAILRGRHRRRLLLMASRDVNVQKVARRWLASVPHNRQVRLHVDVDPYSFL